MATKRAPSEQELIDLGFAWQACRLIHSNAIVFAKNNALVGMGAGQPNRVTSVMLAGRVGADETKGSVMASDAFFPFPDGIEGAAEYGITAVAQPRWFNQRRRGDRSSRPAGPRDGFDRYSALLALVVSSTSQALSWHQASR